jgi:hypothetical protein
MSLDERGVSEGTKEHGWLYNHIGRLAGLFLGLLAFAWVAFLATIGYRPAFFLLMLILAGVAMIAIGGRLRGGMR